MSRSSALGHYTPRATALSTSSPIKSKASRLLGVIIAVVLTSFVTFHLFFGGFDWSGGNNADTDTSAAKLRFGNDDDKDESDRKLRGGVHDYALDVLDPKAHADHYHRGGEAGGHAIDVIDKRSAIREKYGPNGAEADPLKLQNALMETCPVSRNLARQQWMACRIASSSDADQLSAADLRAKIEGNRRAFTEDVVGEADAIVARLGAVQKWHKRNDDAGNQQQNGQASEAPLVERLWEECSWDSMAPIHRILWTWLGFDASRWDAGHSVAVGVSDKPFKDLSSLMQLSAQCLGYTEKTW